MDYYNAGSLEGVHDSMHDILVWPTFFKCIEFLLMVNWVRFSGWEWSYGKSQFDF